MKPEIDKLVMLLSTDWFLEQWTLLCMKSDLPTRLVMMKKCRTIVEQVLGGALNYWEVSFEDTRLLKTYGSFFAAATECKLHVSDINFLRKIADQNQSEIEEGNNISILASLTQLLISDTSNEVIKGVSVKTVETIAPIFGVSNLSRSDIVALCLNSNTDWDKKIRNMTPDLPDMLGDFLLSVYKQMHHFVQFWGRVVENTSLDERAQLIEWYRDTAVKLMCRSLEIPKWMNAGVAH
jgi:hypothetical protein